MIVYLVESIKDYEYGCREVVEVCSSYELAEEYINQQSDNGDVEFWNGSKEPQYTITPWEVLMETETTDKEN